MLSRVGPCSPYTAPEKIKRPLQNDQFLWFYYLLVKLFIKKLGRGEENTGPGGTRSIGSRGRATER